MAPLRVYVKVDRFNKIVIPRGIRKVLDIKPGQKLKLTITGKKLVVTKEMRPLLRHIQNIGRLTRFAAIQKPITDRRCIR